MKKYSKTAFGKTKDGLNFPCVGNCIFLLGVSDLMWGNQIAALFHLIECSVCVGKNNQSSYVYVIGNMESYVNTKIHKKTIKVQFLCILMRFSPIGP